MCAHEIEERKEQKKRDQFKRDLKMLEAIQAGDTLKKIKQHQEDMTKTLISVGALKQKFSLSKMNAQNKQQSSHVKSDPPGRHKFLNEYVRNYENLLCLNDDENKPGQKSNDDSNFINKNISVDFTELEAIRAALGPDFDGYEAAK